MKGMMVMEIQQAMDELEQLQKKLYAYTVAQSSLYLDGVTVAPRDTAAGRGVALGILAGEQHKIFSDPKVGEMLETLAQAGEQLTAEQRRQVELLSREYRQLSRIPAQEYMEYAMLVNEASDVWHRAKETNDFPLFAPVLEKLVAYNRRFAGYYDPDKAPYDALLNEYERGITMAELDKFFATVRDRLVPIIHAIGEKEQPDVSFLHRTYPVEDQRKFSDYLMEVKRKYPDRFFVCGMCEFRRDGFYPQAERLVAQGFKGIKIPAQRLLMKDRRVYLNSDEMMRMFRLMERSGVILSIDLADGDTQVGEMEEVIAECPGLKVAIGHFGMVTTEGWKSQIRLARHRNVMIESGGITWLFNREFYPFRGAVRAIREAADLVGIEKLMWGSDYPRTITAITYRMSYDFVLKSDELTEEDKALFLGRNAERFYGFKRLVDLPYIKNMSE